MPSSSRWTWRPIRPVDRKFSRIGILRRDLPVSGEIPVVTLLGAEASRLIVALKRLATDAPPFTLVGGLAVLARLASVNPYRATGDLDAVTPGLDRDDFLKCSRDRELDQPRKVTA